jgi:hypothetical protein
MLDQKLLIAGMFVAIVINTFRLPAPASSCADIDPSVLTEMSLGYGSGCYPLQNVKTHKIPSGSFVVCIDKEGCGHIQGASHSTARIPKKDDGIVIRDWSQRICYEIDGRESQLTIQNARKLWGEPRKHIVDGRTFYTFDADSIWSGERNVYHIDLGFNKDGLAMAYRIRGIGIKYPKWIQDPNQSWIVDPQHSQGKYE